jgi:hypothetical protein
LTGISASGIVACTGAQRLAKAINEIATRITGVHRPLGVPSADGMRRTQA